MIDETAFNDDPSIDYVEAQDMEDALRAIGRVDDGDDELYLPDELDEDLIARLDEVFNASVAARKLGKTAKQLHKERRAYHVGMAKRLGDNEDHWLIQDVESARELRLERESTPARLWDALEVGVMIDFSVSDGQVSRPRKHHAIH